jgi:hypothetical protein
LRLIVWECISKLIKKELIFMTPKWIADICNADLATKSKAYAMMRKITRISDVLEYCVDETIDTKKGGLKNGQSQD